MVEERNSHTAMLLLDGMVLVAGGGGDPQVSAELYDPSRGSWTVTGSMDKPRIYFTATRLPDGKVLVAGGQSSMDNEVPGVQASAELYDPSSGSWTTTGSMDEGRANHTAMLLLDGRVLVAGGRTGRGDPLASAEVYDPSSGAWAATGSMIEARGGHTATLLPDGRVLVAGGYSSTIGNGDPLASAELFDPSTGSWTATGKMIDARTHHTATLLPDGTVLVAGGFNDDGVYGLASAELYDPSSGAWAATGSMIEARYGQTATLLAAGKVLMAGGYSSSGALASAELYNPASGQWTATVNMVEARFGHTATLLPDGTVLGTGGYLASAELYHPSSGP
jgi:hypothetical protein